MNKIDIEQKLCLNYENTKGSRVWESRVRIKFLSTKQIKAKTSSSIRLAEIIYYCELNFVKMLCVAINKKYNQISSSGLLHASTVRDKSMKNFKNINTEEDEEADNVLDEAKHTGESMGEELRDKIDDELEYVGEEQEESEIKREANESNDDDDDDDEDDEIETEEKKDGEEEEDNEGEMIKKEPLSFDSSFKKKSKKVDPSRLNDVLKVSTMIADYKYDAENHKWIEITFALDALKPRLDLYSVIQREAKKCYISKVDGIKRCFLGQSTLITEGINIKEAIKNSHILDVSRLYLNDIHRMASTFGIEAANKVIINVGILPLFLFMFISILIHDLILIYFCYIGNQTGIWRLWHQCRL